MSINTIPECFANNFHLRDRFSYKDLSLYLFTSEEKEFLVQQILHLEKNPNNNGLLIDPFESDWLNCGATRLVSNRYNINYDTVKGWRRKYKKNKHLNTYSGRPADIDKISHAVILKAIKDAEIPTVEGIRPLVESKVNEIFLQEKNETKKRTFIDMKRAPRLTISSTSIDPKTVSKTISNMPNVHNRTPQGLTLSRFNNMYNIWLTYINAVFTWKIGRYLPACYKIGADCTCFECATSGTGMKVTVYRETDDKRQVTSTEINDDLILLLKYFGLGSGRGDIAPACFIIAHNGMPEETFYYRPMKSLAKFVGGPPGHIYFCLTKGGNAAMWKHWFLNVSIPYIAALDEHYQCKHQDGSRMRPFLRTDGEACILNQAFDEDVMTALDSARIDYLKLGPGMTPVQQDWDLGTMYRDAKSTVKSAARNNEHETLLILTKILVSQRKNTRRISFA